MQQWQALGLNLLIEAPLVWAATARLPCGALNRWSAAIVPSAFSHPWAWNRMRNHGAHDHLLGLILVEVLVCVIEALAIQALTGKRFLPSLSLSLLVNTLSASLAWLIL